MGGAVTARAKRIEMVRAIATAAIITTPSDRVELLKVWCTPGVLRSSSVPFRNLIVILSGQTKTPRSPG